MATKTSEKETLGEEAPVIDEIISEDHIQEAELEKIANREITMSGKSAITEQDFRLFLSGTELEELKRTAPNIAKSMIDDNDEIIEFGREILERAGSASKSALNNQDIIQIDEIDSMVGKILAEVKGYSLKYSKDPGFLDKFMEFFKNKKNEGAARLQAMQDDGKTLGVKLEEISVGMARKMIEVENNIVKSQTLISEDKNSRPGILKVLGALTEIIEQMRNVGLEMVEASNNVQDGVVIWKNQTYMVEEFNEEIIKVDKSVDRAEKMWLIWREKAFLSITNCKSLENIIDVSRELRHACKSVNDIMLPSVTNQLNILFVAEQTKQTAGLVNSVKDGINEITRASAVRMVEAVGDSVKASNRTMLDTETIKAITDSLKEQYEITSSSAAKARSIRDEQIRLIRESEQVIARADTDAKANMVKSVVENMEDARQISGSRNDDANSRGKKNLSFIG